MQPKHDIIRTPTTAHFTRTVASAVRHATMEATIAAAVSEIKLHVIQGVRVDTDYKVIKNRDSNFQHEGWPPMDVLLNFHAFGSTPDTKTCTNQRETLT